jgi:hypothetical protein
MNTAATPGPGVLRNITPLSNDTMEYNVASRLSRISLYEPSPAIFVCRDQERPYLREGMATLAAVLLLTPGWLGPAPLVPPARHGVPMCCNPSGDSEIPASELAMAWKRDEQVGDRVPLFVILAVS